MGKVVKMSKVRIAKVAVRYLLSFLLALVFTVMLLLGMLELSFVNKGVILDIFSREVYAEKVQEFIMETSHRVTYTVGITEEELYGNALNLERINEQATAYADAMLEGNEYEIDVEAFQQDIYDNILLYMDDRGFERSTANLNNAEEMAETVTGYYRDGIAFPYLENFGYLFQTIDRYAAFALLGGTVLCIFLLFLLFSSCQRKYHGAKFVIYAILSAMINILVPTGILYFSKVQERLTIDTAFIQYFISNYVQAGVTRIVLLCLIFIPVVIGLIVWETIAHKKAWNKDRRRHRSHHHTESVQ